MKALLATYTNKSKHIDNQIYLFHLKPIDHRGLKCYELKVYLLNWRLPYFSSHAHDNIDF